MNEGRKFVCGICGYIYEESAGIPKSGIAPLTKWEDLPKSFICPGCNASKNMFTLFEEDQ